MWPHDVESFLGSTFCLYVMVQPWNIGVCWIDQVFVTELTAVIFFVHAAVLSIKTAFNLVKIHLFFRIIPLIQWSVMFCRPCFNRFWGLKYIPHLFSEYYMLFSYQTGYIMWHSRLRIYIPWGTSSFIFIFRISRCPFPYLWRHSSMTSK